MSNGILADRGWFFLYFRWQWKFASIICCTRRVHETETETESVLTFPYRRAGVAGQFGSEFFCEWENIRPYFCRFLCFLFLLKSWGVLSLRDTVGVSISWVDPVLFCGQEKLYNTHYQEYIYFAEYLKLTSGVPISHPSATGIKLT